MHIRYPARPRPGAVPGIAGILALVLLAGCTAGGGDGNLAPRADLGVDKDEGWTGDEFVFDASGSSDSDGEIESWKVDFGDGTPPTEVTEEDLANDIRHAYARGGEFTVTLTVTDSGEEGTGALTDDDETKVAVNERMPIASTTVSAIPGEDGGATQEVPFEVYKRANRYDLNLTFTSLLPTGSSEFEVRVVDPDNKTIGDPESVTVGPGADGQTVDLDGLLTQEGVHRIVITAKSGGGAATGELRIYYGEDLPE